MNHVSGQKSSWQPFYSHLCLYCGLMGKKCFMVQRWDFWLQCLQCHWKRITAPPYPVSSSYRSKTSMALACMIALWHLISNRHVDETAGGADFFRQWKSQLGMRWNWDEEFEPDFRLMGLNLWPIKWPIVQPDSVSESSCLMFWFNHFLSFHHNGDVWHDRQQQQQQRHKLGGTADHTAAAAAAA